MILSGERIREEVEAGVIEIEDFDASRLNPNSYNLRLGNELFFYDDLHLDMKKDNPGRTIEIPPEGIWLEPGTLYLASTLERTATNKYAPMLEGRSSIGRLGLFVHVTAGFGDVGFSGRWTMELSCVQPIKIYAGVEIAQIYFHEVIGKPTFYGCCGRAKYQGATGIQSSRLYEEFRALRNDE